MCHSASALEHISTARSDAILHRFATILLEASSRTAALTGAAIDWLIQLPAELRPKAMSEQFPRIANEIAQQWHDPAGANLLFQKLLNDDRGNRRGFPADVDQELRRLAMHRHAHR